MIEIEMVRHTIGGPELLGRFQVPVLPRTGDRVSIEGLPVYVVSYVDWLFSTGTGTRQPQIRVIVG